MSRRERVVGTLRKRRVVVVCGLALLVAGLRQTWAADGRQHTARRDAGPSGRPKVLVVYYSLTGNTERMARAVADGVRSVPQVDVQVKRVEEVTKEDLQAADGLILGSPTYFANIPGEMKRRLDLWNWKWKVDFTDKIGGAFATGGGQMGGKEHVAISLLLFLLNNRMIVAGPLFQDETGEDKWGEIGAGAMTGPIDPGVSEVEEESGRRLGRRIATLVRRWRSVRTR